MTPKGRRATDLAGFEVATKGGNTTDIMQLRDVYALNGKSDEFDTNVRLYQSARTEEAKTRIYDRLNRSAGYLPKRPPPPGAEPVQPDFTNPEHVDTALQTITNYETTQNIPQLNMAVDALLKQAGAMGYTNPHERSIQEAMFTETDRLAAELVRQENFFVENQKQFKERLFPEELRYDDQWIEEYAVGYGAVMIPFLETTWAKIMGDKFAPEPGQTITSYFIGENYHKMRVKLAEMPQDERERTITEIQDWLVSNPSIPFGTAQVILDSIWDERVAKGDPSGDTFMRVVSNIATVADIGILWGGFKALGMAGRHVLGSGVISAANKVNRPAAQRVLADILTELRTGGVAEAYGLKGVDVAMSQLPAPAKMTHGTNVPDGVVEAAAHLDAVRQDTEAVVSNMRENIFTPKEQAGAIEREAAAIAAEHAGKIRLGRSTLDVAPDGSGVKFGTVVGSSDTHGFSDLASARAFGAKLDAEGRAVKILEVDPSQELRVVEAGVDTTLPNRTGEFYVKFDQEYFFRPEDKLLFGTDPVVGGSWLGRTASYFKTPSAMFSSEVYGTFLRNFLSEQALSANLHKMVAPLYKDLNWASRQKVGQMWSWTEAFGKRENRVPTWMDLRTAFPDVTDKELTGWYYVKQFNDTVYHINNQRVYRDFASRELRTLRAGGTTFHGKPLSVPELAPHKVQGGYVVYDPVRNTPMYLTRGQMKKLYEDGGSVLKLDAPVSAGPGNQMARLVLHNPAGGSELGALSKFPLQYIPGWSPRLYKDPIFIRRVSKAAVIDGHTTEHVSTVSVARDRKEAQEFVDRMNRNRADDSVEYTFDASDARLSDKDRTARDIEMLQMEGRLFFDKRNVDPLTAVSGGFAETVDPINALNRTSHMLSRQLSTEDLVKNTKSQFFMQYANLLPANPQTRTSSEITATLEKMTKGSHGPESKRAAAALNLWNYVRVMEGSIYGGGAEFRAMSVRAADFLQKFLPKGSKVGTLIARNADRVSPVEFMKSLAFFDFMTTRPLRQLVLQGGQHLFLAPLDPTYAGKWQWDTFLLMSGARGRNLELSGGKAASDALRVRNSKMMGLSTDEYDRLIQEFDRSGLKQAVNMHTFQSDVVSDLGRTHMETKTGRAAQLTGDVLTAKPVRDVANKYGFQAGEGYNVAASYMMALRRTMKEGKMKSLLELDTKQWRQVQERASNYALAMVRPNASAYQYGIFSLPMQFLSFTHKVALTLTFQNKAITRTEAGKLLAGQLLMFGGAGIALKDETRTWLQDSGLDLPEPVVDLISGGMVDMVLDYAIQKAVGDPDLDLPFDEFLAPGANVINVLKSFYEAGFENTPAETALGPSATTAGRLLEAAKVGYMVGSVDYPTKSPEEELRIVLDAVLSGVASGYNDYLKGSLAWHTGKLLSNAGIPHSYHATREEALAKGLFGITAESKNELFKMSKDFKDREKDLNEIADEFQARMLRLGEMYSNGTFNSDYIIDKIAAEKWLLAGLPEEERTYVLDRVRTKEANRPPNQPSIADLIIAGLNKGVPVGAESLIKDIERSKTIAPKDKAPLIELIRKQDTQLREAGQLWERELDVSARQVTELTEAQKNALAKKAKSLPPEDLEGRAAIAAQLGASQEEIDAIMAKAPRRLQ